MLDKDLRPEHIQSISNADEVAGFFSYLGYNTSNRIIQSSSNLGITNETLLKEIKKVELLADHENLLQVYLFELSSVSVGVGKKEPMLRGPKALLLEPAFSDRSRLLRL